jgi:glycosyltransferase involved in cell wall biosynthesis
MLSIKWSARKGSANMKKRAKLSVVMIARNAAHQIGRTLQSVKWADEICVADTGSSDNTIAKAEQWGAKTKSISFEGFGRAKQEAVRMASHDWILSLDSDEVVTPELKQEIRRFLSADEDYVGADLGRVTNLCGHWILHSGWYPEYVMRLFDRRHCRFNDRKLHESVIAEGRIKRLSGRLLHYSYPNMQVYLNKSHDYARLGALSKASLPAILKLIYMFAKPLIVFLKKLVVQRGFLDGVPGLWIAALSAYGQLLKYYHALKLRKQV